MNERIGVIWIRQSGFTPSTASWQSLVRQTTVVAAVAMVGDAAATDDIAASGAAATLPIDHLDVNHLADALDGWIHERSLTHLAVLHDGTIWHPSYLEHAVAAMSAQGSGAQCLAAVAPYSTAIGGSSDTSINDHAIARAQLSSVPWPPTQSISVHMLPERMDRLFAAASVQELASYLVVPLDAMVVAAVAPAPALVASLLAADPQTAQIEYAAGMLAAMCAGRVVRVDAPAALVSVRCTDAPSLAEPDVCAIELAAVRRGDVPAAAIEELAALRSAWQRARDREALLQTQHDLQREVMETLNRGIGDVAGRIDAVSGHLDAVHGRIDEVHRDLLARTSPEGSLGIMERITRSIKVRIKRLLRRLNPFAKR